MKIMLDDIGAAQSLRAQPRTVEDEKHARAVALLEILNRQRADGIGDLTSFTPVLSNDAPGQSAFLSGAQQLSNAGFAAPQGNVPVAATAGASPAIDVPFGGGVVAAPVAASLAQGGAPQQLGFSGAETIANQPLNAGLFNDSEQAPQGPIADDGGHNRRQSDGNRKPSAVEITALRAKYRTLVAAGRARFFFFAADNLSHWLGGKGGARKVSWNWLLKQPSFRAAYNENMDSIERDVETLERNAQSNGYPATASATSFATKEIRPTERNFFYGANESDLDTRAKINVTVGSNGKMTTKVDFDHWWHDDYNWNKDQFVEIRLAFGASIPFYDNDAIKLKNAGFGADFKLLSNKKEKWG